MSTVGEQCTPATCAGIGHHGPVTDAPQPVTDPLTLAALDTERHVARAGWDQPVRLFALVPTADLLAHEPQLADGLAAHDAVAGALSAVEQEELPEAGGARGAAGAHRLARRRSRAAPSPWSGSSSRRMPSATSLRTTDAALRAVADHPDRADVRLLVAVTRDGSSRCLLRQRAHDSDDRVALGEDIAPGLVHALRATFSPF